MSARRNDEVRDIWNANAAYWDERMGEGNDFHNILIEPNQIELLDINKGDAILDIACGNGQFSREMTKLGARVTAIDFSDALINIARSKPFADRIDYQVIDVTRKADLEKLRGNTFDSIDCTMAIMDMVGSSSFSRTSNCTMSSISFGFIPAMASSIRSSLGFIARARAISINFFSTGVRVPASLSR